MLWKDRVSVWVCVYINTYLWEFALVTRWRISGNILMKNCFFLKWFFIVSIAIIYTISGTDLVSQLLSGCMLMFLFIFMPFKCLRTELLFISTAMCLPYIVTLSAHSKWWSARAREKSKSLVEHIEKNGHDNESIDAKPFSFFYFCWSIFSLCTSHINQRVHSHFYIYIQREFTS